MANQYEIDNPNFLSPLGFRFGLQRAPNLTYFCQGATMPTVSLGEVTLSTPVLQRFEPTNIIDYQPLQIRFRVDEDLKNYLELFDWMTGLAPTDLEDRRKYENAAVGDVSKGIVSDSFLMILSSNMNPHTRIDFYDTFPQTLAPLTFDTTQMDIEYLECDVTFRYRNFNITRL
jgi:hypothetical protein